ncbi:VHS1 [Cyberlindnera jadinii]|uniref:non-specific serine/threonine protein kinase n=1 Tax=Cyberlindnera jadinii (strain ATCC 18201 / CBS 1600 / BCRC 20928 / JCM 3617 / NBRC 0987 / NRRL Y-1542) TaxID=983966 RepID=A0A0H5BZX6_CYBJN|nr:VHS1 [Cyberlindnera jadinii]
MTHTDITGSLINEYRIVKLIGSGAYGLVYQAQNTVTGQQVAIKCISKKSNPSVKKQSDYLTTLLAEHLLERDFSLQGLREMSLKRLSMADNIPCPFVREISIHLQVHQHPNVISIHKILDSQVAVFVVMDYYPEGDLFVNIVDRQVYARSSGLIKDVFIQLIDVISYCHSKGIYHCDIKPENIMCANKGSKVVIGDFGLAVKSKYIQSKTCIGSSYYMAPERLCTMNHSLTRLEYPACKGDIWSLGVILINFCCTRNPWMKACEKDATYSAFKKDPKILMEILDISEELWNILCDCFREEPEERISLFELRDRVLKCRSFTVAGPLSRCDSYEQDMDDALECAVPANESSVGSDGSLDLPMDHIIEYAQYLQTLSSVKNTATGNYTQNQFVLDNNIMDNVSIMSNKSFNMNFA